MRQSSGQGGNGDWGEDGRGSDEKESVGDQDTGEQATGRLTLREQQDTTPTVQSYVDGFLSGPSA
jgi:hypothetical protein